MSVPLQISFRNISHSAEIEEMVKERARKLDRFTRIINCRVVIEVPHRHHVHGNHYSVRLDISVPGRDIVVAQDSGDRKEYSDLRIALKDAFDAAVRQLDDYRELRRGA